MKKRVGIIILVLLLLILAGGGAAFYYYYSKYINIDAIYPGMTIQGMSVGGMTREEAKAKVQEYVDKVSQETVTLQVKKKESTFALSDIGLKCTNMDVVEKACFFHHPAAGRVLFCVAAGDPAAVCILKPVVYCCF